MKRNPATLRGLWQGQERFRGAFLHSGIGMALVSQEGRFLDVNPALCGFLGYSEKELLQMDFQAISHPDDLGADLDQVKRMLNREIETYSMEKRYRHKDGHWFWIELTVSLVWDEEGHPLFFISQVQDISMRRSVEDALRKSEGLLKAAQRVAGVGSWFMKFAASGQIGDPDNEVWWSDETFRIFGYEPGSVRPGTERFLSHVHPDDQAEVLQTAERALAERSRYAIDFRAITAGGEERYFNETAEVFSDPQTGRPAGFLGTILDITARKRVEEELRVSQERLRLATAAGRIGTWDYELRSGRLVWNEVTYELFGLKSERFTPDLERVLQLIHVDDAPQLREGLERCLESCACECCQRRDEACEWDFRFFRPDNEIRHGKLRGEIVCEGERSRVRFVGTLVDVTVERRALDAARAADRAKSEFLAMMSHEIRTPMNAVLGFTALLKNSRLDPEQAGYLETIESSGERLLALINDMLDLTRVEAGITRIAPVAFDLRGFVQEVFESLRSGALKKGLGYECRISERVPPGILSDRGRLGQVLTNLLGNALKFTNHGQVTLDVSAIPSGRGQWVWRFRVEDTGPGISAEALPHIFEPFFQADSSNTRQYGGTGLGLSISRRLARLLGGDILIEPKAEGSLFSLIIEAPEAESPAAESVAAPLSFPGCRILVVEDNEVNRRLCKLQLAQLGCATDFAENGREAVQKAISAAYDAVLMDVQLPDLDGYEATRQIRSRQEGKPRLPIIAMTANAMPEDREECLQAGMDDYLSKPLNVPTLARVLARWVGSQPGAVSQQNLL